MFRNRYSYMDKPQIKVLSRNTLNYMRATKQDIHKISRNYSPSIHPYSAGREYTRALNATKLDRVFAKPFMCSLDGHRDGVYCLAKHPRQLSTLFSGACDGELRVWDLQQNTCIHSVQAHTGFVRAICIGGSIAEKLITVGDDKTIKIWRDPSGGVILHEPIAVIMTSQLLMGCDHSCRESSFATCGTGQVDVWDEERAEAVSTFKWDTPSNSFSDSINSVRYNPVETCVLASTGSDRSVMLYDVRQSTVLKKLTLKSRSNQLCWNPMEAYNFTLACEDSNLYTFDMRNLDIAANVHQDHLGAVMDVDYSPTGREFVSASYDKTIRIFPSKGSGHSREIYHTKRMQRVFGVKWSLDAHYIISCSDETNIRLWKANASEKLIVTHYREKSSLEYKAKLREKYKHHPQIKRIAKHRHIPRYRYHAREEKRGMIEKEQRKQQNRIIHSKPGSVDLVPERKKAVLKIED